MVKGLEHDWEKVLILLSRKKIELTFLPARSKYFMVLLLKSR